MNQRNYVDAYISQIENYSRRADNNLVGKYDLDKVDVDITNIDNFSLNPVIPKTKTDIPWMNNSNFANFNRFPYL